jgi:hypothetical protein
VTEAPVAFVPGPSSRPDGLPTGPADPLPGPPARRPGTIRRTTSVDARRADPGEPTTYVAAGRDVRTRADGTLEVLDEARLTVTVDGSGTVTALEAAPRRPALDALVAGPVRKGLRQRVDGLVPEDRDEASVLHQLLDDLPLAALIASYGSSREVPDFTLPPESAASMAEVCSGWVRGGTMLGTLEATGIFPIPMGPPAPALVDAGDPDGWHALPTLVPRSTRRVRRLDVARVDGVVEVEAHFRDSHLGQGTEPEDVLHEYLVHATVDAASLEVRSCAATARVLPWPECPGALASAGRAVGLPVGRLRQEVSTRFTGTTTCTHLNDTLRSLAGVAPLVRALP